MKHVTERRHDKQQCLLPKEAYYKIAVLGLI